MTGPLPANLAHSLADRSAFLAFSKRPATAMLNVAKRMQQGRCPRSRASFGLAYARPGYSPRSGVVAAVSNPLTAGQQPDEAPCLKGLRWLTSPSLGRV